MKPLIQHKTRTTTNNMTQYRITQSIISQLMRCRRALAGSEGGQHNHLHCQTCCAVLQARIEQSLQAKETLTLVIPAFPAKSANPNKTLGELADKAEEVALTQLNQLAHEIALVYPYGVNIMIASDGHVFGRLVGVSDTAVERYYQSCLTLRDAKQLSYLSFYRLDDYYPGLSYDEMRQRLTEEFAQSIETWQTNIAQSYEKKNLFNGIHRFVFEDMSAHEADLSRNQIRKIAKSKTIEVMQRSDAWGRLLQSVYPNAIRLSIHPQACGSAKFPINLVSNGERWATPWHNVLIKSANTVKLVPRKIAEALGADLVYENNRPSHYILTGATHAI